MQDIIVAAVVDAVVAMKTSSRGVPNVVLRDLNAIHQNTGFADLPPNLQVAVTEAVRSGFTRMLREGYVLAPKQQSGAAGRSASERPALRLAARERFQERLGRNGRRPNRRGAAVSRRMLSLPLSKVVENLNPLLPLNAAPCHDRVVSNDAPAIRLEPGSGRYDPDARLFRFNAADGHSRFTCAVSQATFERLTGVKIDLENARHLFADWESTVFRAAAQAYAAVGRQRGGGLLVEFLPASA